MVMNPKCEGLTYEPLPMLVNFHEKTKTDPQKHECCFVLEFPQSRMTFCMQDPGGFAQQVVLRGRPPEVR